MHTYGLADLQDDERDTARVRRVRCSFRVCKRTFLTSDTTRLYCDPVCSRREHSKRINDKRQAKRKAA